jgi:FkbM family methyltransferase
MFCIDMRGCFSVIQVEFNLNTPQRYYDILKGQPHPLKFLASRVLWRSGFCSLFTIRKEGYRLKFYPTALSAILWVNPQDRQDDEIFLRRYLRAGDTFVDVGSNIGDLTLAGACVVGREGKVYSFEAHPRTYGFLSANVALNRCLNVLVFNVALGDKESTIFLVDVGRSDDQNRVSENGRGISMKITRLDDVPIAERHIQLLKIDVEGYEKFVLEGASRRLGNTSCVYFESSERNFRRYGYTCGDLLEILVESGFKIFKFAGNDTLVAVDVGYKSATLENLIAVRDLGEFLYRTQFHLAA